MDIYAEWLSIRFSLVEPKFLFPHQLWEIRNSHENPDFPTRAVMRYGLEKLWNIPVRSTLLTHSDLYQFCCHILGYLSKGNFPKLLIVKIRQPGQFIFSLVFFHPLSYFILNSLSSMIDFSWIYGAVFSSVMQYYNIFTCTMSWRNGISKNTCFLLLHKREGFCFSSEFFVKWDFKELSCLLLLCWRVRFQSNLFVVVFLMKWECITLKKLFVLFLFNWVHYYRFPFPQRDYTSSIFSLAKQ